LIRVALYSSSRSQIVADGLAESLAAAGIDRMDGAGKRVSTVTADEAGPDLERKMIERRLMNAKGSPATCPGREWKGGIKRGSAGHWAGSRWTWGSLAVRLRNGHQLLRQGTGNKCAGSDAAFKVTLRVQLCIAIEHGEARDAELDGELPAGGNPVTWAQIAAQDCLAVSLVNLLMQRAGGGAVYGEDGQGVVR